MEQGSDHESSSSDQSDGFEDEEEYDIEAVFDSVVHLEKEFIDQGKQSGKVMVKDRSYAEGYQIGKLEGSKLGQELGFYHGFIDYLQFQDLPDRVKVNNKLRAQRGIIKISKQLQRMSLSAQFLDEQDAMIKESLQIIRSTFKSLVQSFDGLQSIIEQESSSIPESIIEMLKTKENTSNLHSIDEMNNDLGF